MYILVAKVSNLFSSVEKHCSMVECELLSNTSWSFEMRLLEIISKTIWNTQNRRWRVWLLYDSVYRKIYPEFRHFRTECLLSPWYKRKFSHFLSCPSYLTVETYLAPGRSTCRAKFHFKKSCMWFFLRVILFVLRYVFEVHNNIFCS